MFLLGQTWLVFSTYSSIRRLECSSWKTPVQLSRKFGLAPKPMPHGWLNEQSDICRGATEVSHSCLYSHIAENHTHPHWMLRQSPITLGFALALSEWWDLRSSTYCRVYSCKLDSRIYIATHECCPPISRVCVQVVHEDSTCSEQESGAS